MFNNITFNLTNNLVYSPALLRFYFNKVWKQIIIEAPAINNNNNNNNKHISILLKITFLNNETRTLGNLQYLNLTNEDKKYYLRFIKDLISLKNDNYQNTPIIALTFRYKLNDGLAPNRNTSIEGIPFHTYYNNKLPISLEPKEYGEVLYNDNNVWTIRLNNLTFIRLEEIRTTPEIWEGIFQPHNKVSLFKNSSLMFTWKDFITSPNNFERVLGKSRYIFSRKGVNDPFELDLHLEDKLTPFIKKIKTSKKIKSDMITMDLETYNKDGTLIPYLLCWYDGENKKSYWINDYPNITLAIKAAINDIQKLSVIKDPNKKIYLHNFSGFDGIFILKDLIKLGKCKLIKREDKIINFQFLGNKGNKLTFRDSMLLLPSSLISLGKSFLTSNIKDLFPIKFNNINYIGPVPDIKYFKDGITLKDYNNYCLGFKPYTKKVWSFKEESIKYCYNDCISLHEILNKFNELVFKYWKLNIQNYPTLPSLAFGIFRAHFLKENTIACLTGNIYKNIKESYTGGAVDMYIPNNDSANGEKVYGYDVNSLYPAVMKDNLMPVGSPTYFEGDIFKHKEDPFGFFQCDVIAPENLKNPIIQIHHKTKDGVRTVAPLGKFSGMFFSEEIKNAQKYGYKFKVNKGYLFKKGNIFFEYVKTLFGLRIKFSKKDAMNFITKLLLNSLYGRFGMAQSFDNIKIIKTSSFEKFERRVAKLNLTITNIMELDDFSLISFNTDTSPYFKKIQDPNINIAVASAITAYARIEMSKYKNNSFYKLFYSDTDSIYINQPLPKELVSNTELGKMKLESISNKAIFLAPKVYGLTDHETGEETIKIKGLSKEASINNKITVNTLESLLKKDNTIELNQDKWYKSIKESSINIKEQIYSLKATANKRDLIYKYKKLINTSPIIIK